MLLGFCSVSKINCVKFLIPLQGHLNKFRYIMVCGKKSFTVCIKYITIFKTYSRPIPDAISGEKIQFQREFSIDESD